MIDLPNTENLRAFAAAILRFQRLSEGIPESDHWRWLLFDKDLQSNAKFSRGSVGPTVSLGLPWLSADCSLRWLAPRLFFWPQGIPGGHRVSLISSRLKQRLDEESWWFDLLRTATLRSHPTSDILCAVTGTAAHRFVRRAAEIFGRSLLEFQVDSRSFGTTITCHSVCFCTIERDSLVSTNTTTAASGNLCNCILPTSRHSRSSSVQPSPDPTF